MKRHALIVDNDAAGRTLTATVLRDVIPDIRVTEATDAISLAEALTHSDLEVAIVTRELGWADGLELMKLLRRRHPGCATILLGATPENQIDPDAQPDAHLSRSITGLASLGQVILRSVEKRSRSRHTAAEALGRVPVAILELAHDERVLSANARTVALLGYEDEKAIIGRSLDELLSTTGSVTEIPETSSIVGQAAAMPEGLSVLTRPATGTPVAHRLLVRAETRDGFIRGFTAALIPASSRAGAHVDNLVFAVSHDLQQPLATTGRSAKMLADRLQSSGRLGGQEERMLRRIVSGTERMETLMKGLVDYVRTGQELVVRERVDLGQVCEEVVHGLQSQIEDSAGMVRWSDLPVIQASRAEITRLLENLVGNAMKFHGSQKPVVDIECVQREDSWLLSVRDNGIGLDPGDAERIFQPFQRLHTESEYPGTGIGLAICHQICERHGGRIWATPNPEGGSTFFATISTET